MEYDFTFVIPVFNSAQFLNKCISSILNQQYNIEKLQIILINDGSTDGSLEICNKYAKSRNNILVIDQYNQGVSVARNNGIRQAKGKYIIFLDSDDFIDDNLCKEVFKFFEKNYNKIDVVVYPLVNYKNGKLTGHFRYSNLYSKNNRIYNIDENPELIQTTINVCIKNEPSNQIYFDDSMKFSEDEKFATQIIMKRKKFGFCPKANYYYRKNVNSCTSNYFITEDQFNSYCTYYSILLNEYNDQRYIKNLFLNTFRWRLEQSKLFPNDADNKERYLKTIKLLLDKIDIEDVFSLSYLKPQIIMAILELKKIDYKIYQEKNKNIIECCNKKFYFENKCTVIIDKLLYDRHPIIRGKVDTLFLDNEILNKKNSDNLINFVKRPMYEDSFISKVSLYAFECNVMQFNSDIDLSYLSPQIEFKIKNKSYRLRYKVYYRGSKIIVTRMNILDILKKVAAKLRRKK